MTDIASLGLEIDTRQVVDGKKALDQFGEASAQVEQKVKSNNGQMADTAKIMRAQAEQARATAAANMALGTSADKMTLGAQLFIEKLQDQVAVLGMSRSQLVAYQAAQLGVSSQAADSVAKLKAYEDQIKAAADAKAQAATKANVLTDALGMLAKGYAALKVAEYIKDAALLSARYETLGIVSLVVGRNAGYTKVQMDYATDAIARQGITMIESRQSAIKLVQAHVDLTNATGLARIAQDAAVIGNINSSEAFDRLVNGVARGNVLILRNIGINVNLEAAYQQMAQTLGKTTGELTENERVQARLSAVMERGADIAGTYEAAMGTAGKQLLSMKRYTEDLKTVIGETFNEVLTISVMALTAGLKDANHEVTELSKNDQLRQWGHDLAATFVWIADQVNNAATVMQKAWAWADHRAARDAINAEFDKKRNDLAARTSNWSIGTGKEGTRLASERAAALAQETVDYETHNASLSSQFDRFSKAQAERDAATTAKHKADVEARLKVDQDYATKATALLVANAGKSVEAQQAAQMALAKSVYIGTPTYRDSEGKTPKPKVDQAESTAMADHIARLEAVAAAEKKHCADLSTLDDMYHKAGELSDQQFFANKRKYSEDSAAAQMAAYDKELGVLRSHHSATAAEAARVAKQIGDIEDKRMAAKVANGAESHRLDEEERLRQKAIEDGYLQSVDKSGQAALKSLQDQITKEAEHGREIGKTKVQIDEMKQAQQDAATADLQNQEAAVAGLLQQNDLNAEAKRIYQDVLVQLQSQIEARRTLAGILGSNAIAQADADAAKAASDAWNSTAKHVETTLADAIANGGGNAWKKLKASIVSQALSVPINFVGNTIASALNPGAAQAGSGILGSAGSAASMYNAASGGMAGLTGSLGSGIAFAGNALGSSSLSAFGAGFAGTTGAEMGTVAEGFASAGMAAEASAASLGAAFSAALPWVGGAVVAYKVLDKLFSGGPESDTRLTFASNNTVGNINNNERGESWAAPYIGNGSTSALGTFGVKSDFWMDPNQPVVQSFLKTVGQTDDALAAFMTTAEKASVSSYLSGQTYTAHTGVEGSNPNANGQLDAVFANRINNILEGLQPGLSALEAGFSGTSQQLAAEAAALLQYRASLKDSGTALFGAEVTLQQIAGLKLPTEATSVALNRVAAEFQATNQVAALLGKDATTAFGAVGLASEAARAQIILLSGGISNFTSMAGSYAQNYLTDAERLAPVAKALDAQLATMGLATIPQTKDQFKALVDSLNLSTDGGQRTYAALMSVQDAFSQVHVTLDGVARSAADIANERTGLQDQLDQLTMSSTELLNKQRDALDASNRALFDQVQAAQAAKDAVTASAAASAAAAQVAADAIAKAQAAAAAATSSLGNSLMTTMNAATAAAAAFRSLNDALVQGTQSTLSSEAKYAAAKRQYQSASGTGLQAAEQALLTASKAVNGNSVQYARDFAEVYARNGREAAAQDAIPASIIAFWRGMNANGGIDGSHAGGLDYVPFNGYRAELHQGERVLTASQNKAYRDGGSDAALRENTAVLNKVLAAVVENTKHTRKTAEIWQRVTKDGNSLLTTVA